MYTLDKIDKKIMIIISENPRISYTDLGKLIGLTKNTAKYRLDKLMGNVIWKIMPVVNYQKLLMHPYDVFFKCSLTLAKKKEFEKYISKHKNVLWATSLFGRWDYYIEFLCKDVFEFDEVVQDVVKHMGNVEEYKTHLSTDRLKIKPLLSEITEGVDFKYEFKWPKLNFKPDKIDDLDRKILHTLCKNGRMHYYEVAERLKVSLPTIINRINRMINENIIMKFVPIMWYYKLGYTRNFIVLKMRNYSLADKEKLRKWFEADVHTKLALRAANTNEILTFVCFKTNTDLENYISELRRNFHNIIQDVTILNIIDELKLDYFPSGFV
jgi:Lrp/AsnC family transcriptional regulator, leucine-responsive regulatory protein